MKLSKMNTEDLLSLKMKELTLEIKHSKLQTRIDSLNEELSSKHLEFRPHIWISDEWFTPDDMAGFAVPFYLAHPRLIKLEKEQMFEAEGSEKKECMRILRHETGHAISHAYQLYFLKEWKKIFGDFRKPYPLWYVPDISSKNFVTHLNAWYAQAHPLEDFAETFAVWLNPSSNWRKIYKTWPAIIKLNYIEKMMGQIRGMGPIISGKDEYTPLFKIKRTLKEHYEKKKRFYTAEWSHSFDLELNKLFMKNLKDNPDAAEYIKKKRRSLRSNIAAVLDIPPYTVDQMILQMIRRTIQLNLSLRNEEYTESRLLVILTSQLINSMQTGYHRIPL